jgi:hypothetical protein
VNDAKKGDISKAGHRMNGGKVLKPLDRGTAESCDEDGVASAPSAVMGVL